MRILVTGVSGQVGSVLTSTFAEFGTVVAADRNLLDLGDVAAIPTRLDALSPDVIVNPAAYTAVDRAEDEPELAFRINGDAPGVLARWAAERQVPVMHFSTDYVFGGKGETPWREGDAPAPLSVYGKSKLQGEIALRAAGGPHLIVRTSWVYHRTGTNFLRTVAGLAAEREELRIVADQIGAPTSARLIGETLAALLRQCNGNFAGLAAAADGTVHLTASGGASWYDFATAIVAGLKARNVPVKARRVIPITTAEYPTKATRPGNSRLDLSRITLLLGRPLPSWQSALDAELDQWRSPAGRLSRE
jgi:dTDP-4-dehydrorhamnose reductase